MPGPKSRISRSKRGMRRAHNALTAINTQDCPNCSSVRVPHKVCPSCGYYKGKEITAAKV